MYSDEFLHSIRDCEIAHIMKHFPPRARILEIGGGAGYQAQKLSACGFDVTSIDVSTSAYKQVRVFPIIEYDGDRIPFGAHTFDVVFTSNALEHIHNLAQMHRESRRVLKPGGFCVHVMPTAVWRFWTSSAHYVDLVQRHRDVLDELISRLPFRSTQRTVASAVWDTMKFLKGVIIPSRHGATGSAFTELATFSRPYWRNHFRKHQMTVLHEEPLRLFYTGYFVSGARWSLPARRRAAAWLGSACVLYKTSFGENRYA